MKLTAVPAGADLPPGWMPATFEYADDDLGAFGSVAYQADGTWYAFCEIAFHDDFFEGHYPTAAEAIEAVMGFVRDHLGGQS